MGVVTHADGLVLGGLPRPPTQGGMALADANFAGSPLPMRIVAVWCSGNALISINAVALH